MARTRWRRKEITYNETVRIGAVHKPTGISTSFVVPMKEANPIVLRSITRKKLTEAVRNVPPERNRPEQVNDGRIQQVVRPSVYFRPEREQREESTPRGFEGNESASRWEAMILFQYLNRFKEAIPALQKLEDDITEALDKEKRALVYTEKETLKQIRHLTRSLKDRVREDLISD